jgi:peptide-methionine (S)-S-oxide reductase
MKDASRCWHLVMLGVLLFAAGPVLAQQAALSGSAPPFPAPVTDNPKTAGAAQTVVLAGGCFWGIQGLFRHVRGVRRAVSGYSGGSAEQADYAWVSSGMTRHAEAVQVTFDPAVISLGEILQIFFSVAHDPTQVNEQWPDVGPQYRSAIFYADAAQQQLASAYVAQLAQAGVFRRSLATRLEPLTAFYPAEAYHQDYLLQHPRAAYIAMHDLPKLRELQRVWPTRYRERAIDSQGNERSLVQ